VALAQTITAVPQVAGHKHAFTPELDGVRGVAILLVMVYHSFLILPTPALLISLWLTLPISLGWSGVDLFFVLSGFLITGILINTKESRNYFSSFYARRILRIFPLYFLVVFLYFDLALPIAHHFGQLIYLTKTFEPWFWFHLSNWKVAFTNPAGWLEHFWSLSIEEQFYMFWPLVIFWTPRRRIVYVCLLLIGASFALRCLYAHGIYGFRMVYMLTPFRIEPLAFGSLAAILVQKPALASRLRNRRLLSIAAGIGMLLLMGAVVVGGSPIEGVPLATVGLTALASFTPVSFYTPTYTTTPPAGWPRRCETPSCGRLESIAMRCTSFMFHCIDSAASLRSRCRHRTWGNIH
jgi:peptidoglycan/LPS O-acetylase OafA/YrhL